MPRKMFLGIVGTLRVRGLLLRYMTHHSNIIQDTLWHTVSQHLEKTKHQGQFMFHFSSQAQTGHEEYLGAHEVHQRRLFLSDVLDDLFIDPGSNASFHQRLSRTRGEGTGWFLEVVLTSSSSSSDLQNVTETIRRQKGSNPSDSSCNRCCREWTQEDKVC